MDWRELSVCSFHVLLFLSTQTHLQTSATQESKEGINFCTKPTSIPYLTPKGQRVFLLKIASKQPLLKTSRIVQNWNQCWYFQQ
jgi:hypothetical protein